MALSLKSEIMPIIMYGFQRTPVARRDTTTTYLYFLIDLISIASGPRRQFHVSHVHNSLQKQEA